MRKVLQTKTLTIPESSDEAKTTIMSDLQESIAPQFLKAEEILNEISLWPLFVNIFSACFCMGCSAIYHLMYVKGVKYQENLSRLDYGGISILIFGSAFPILYYAMACVQISLVKLIYMWSLAIVCLICFAVTLIPEFDKPNYRKARGLMYILLGLGSGIMFIMF